MSTTTHVDAKRRGAAAVEFALVLPVLVLLLIAAVEFGHSVYVYEHMVHAAREGVRARALEGPGGPIQLPSGGYPKSAAVVTRDCLAATLPNIVDHFVIEPTTAAESYAGMTVRVSQADTSLTGASNLFFGDSTLSVRLSMEFVNGN